MRIIAKAAVVVIVAATGAVVPNASAFAATHTRVVHPGHSIQKAIDKSKSGDKVVVKSGHYAQAVTIQTNGLTVVADGTVTLTPPKTQSGPCDAPGNTNGFCIVPADIDPASGTFVNRVRNVTVRGFVVKDFTNGLFAFGTDNLRVSGMRASDNDEYGITRFDSINGYFKDNWASGAGESAFYIGDSPNSNALIQGNHATNSTFGFLVRHVRGATLWGNEATRNCVAITLLNDGQPEGTGNNRVAENYLHGNNKVCPPNPDEGLPGLAGNAILLIGADHNLIERNRITGNNRGGSLASGGIVLATADPGGIGSTNNVVRHNKLSGNQPADILYDAASTPNRYNDNRCQVSLPAGLC